MRDAGIYTFVKAGGGEEKEEAEETRIICEFTFSVETFISGRIVG